MADASPAGEIPIEGHVMNINTAFREVWNDLGALVSVLFLFRSLIRYKGGKGSRELYVFKIQMNKKTLTSTFSYEMPWYDVPCIFHSAKPLSQSLLKIKPWFRNLRGHLGSG